MSMNMALDILLDEARGLPEDALMEVVRFTRFIKIETRSKSSEIGGLNKNKKVLRTAGKYRGKIKMTEDFDEPLTEFKEYM